MISEREAHKHYDRNTPVIRRGDPGWTSDNHLAGREGESYGTNPTSVMDQKIRQRNRAQAVVPDIDPSTLEEGDRTVTGDGRDAFHWEVRRVVDEKRTFYPRMDEAERATIAEEMGEAYDPEETPIIYRYIWRLRFTERNGDR